jgi:hypothetical protein
LQAGDEITAVNGIELKNTSSSIQGIIQGISAPDFPILVNRGGQTLKFQITPVSRDGQPYSGSGQRYIGMDLQPPPSVTIKLPFSEAVAKSVSTNVEYEKKF